MNAILSAILPVFLVAGAAYVVSRRMRLDIKTFSSANIYLFLPALVFSSLSGREIEWGSFGRIAIASTLGVVVMTIVFDLVARLRGLEQGERGAFLMTMFPNLGNFGLPVCRFAFGEEGLAIAVVIMVCGSFLQNSVGVYFAHRHRHAPATAFLRVLRFPIIYAFALALVFQRFGLRLPEAADRAVQITGDAAIPVQLMILGIQLAQTRLDTGANVFLGSALRLLGGPLLAAGLVLALRFDSLAAKVFITQMSGPVAVGMTAYGAQFDVAPRFLASVVAWSFLLSLITVSCVLLILGTGPP